MGVFILTELPAAGDPGAADDGERFEWASDSRASQVFDGRRGGGARACPIKPWPIGGEQRKVRTNYPGAKLPSTQVLGPIHLPQLFTGRWDDRYNAEGYALFEMRRFVDMCERGNDVRIQFGTLAFEGLIENWKCDPSKPWRITYEFSLDVHNRPEQTDRSRVPITPPDTGTLLDRFDFAAQATLDADDLAPRGVVSGSLADDVTAGLVNLVNLREELADTIDQSEFTAGVDAFTRVATQFRAARGAAYGLILRLAAVRADLDMSVQTAMSVLDFEDWIRSLRFAARVAMGTARTGYQAATERSEPDAVRLYRPSEGEHLYQVSRKFYGTPHAWRLIYDRNSLQSVTLTGSEILIIPERGGT